MLGIVAAFADVYGDFIGADAQAVTVEETLRMALADWRVCIVDVDAVATGIDQIVGAGLMLDHRVPAGDIAVCVRQHPVVVVVPADRAADGGKFTQALFRRKRVAVTDNPEPKRHVLSCANAGPARCTGSPSGMSESE